jgi:hypothetical protein
MAGDTSKQEARAQAARPEDRLKKAEPVAIVPAFATAQKSGGGLVKVAAGGVAGIILGVILGGLSAVVVVLKTARKVLIPFK